MTTDDAKALIAQHREHGWAPQLEEAFDLALSALDEVERLRRSFDVQVGALNESRAKLAKLEAEFNRLRAENADQKKRLLFLTTACQGYESVERKLKARLEELDDRPDE